MNTPASVSGRDVTASPIPFLTPSGDDVNPPVYTLHGIHSAIETPHESHDITDSLSPFPTPRKEDDFVSPRKLHQMYPRKKELKVAEDIPKVFFITAVGNCDSNTISSVGRYLLGDSKYESILKEEEREQTKRLVNQIYEEWKKKGEGDIELQNAFKAIKCQELIDKMNVFHRKQTRLFSFD